MFQYFMKRMHLRGKISYYPSVLRPYFVAGGTWRSLHVLSHGIIGWKIYHAYSMTHHFIGDHKPGETKRFFLFLFFLSKGIVSSHWMGHIPCAVRECVTDHCEITNSASHTKMICQNYWMGRISKRRNRVLKILDVHLWLSSGGPTMTKTDLSDPLDGQDIPLGPWDHTLGEKRYGFGTISPVL